MNVDPSKMIASNLLVLLRVYLDECQCCGVIDLKK